MEGIHSCDWRNSKHPLMVSIVDKYWHFCPYCGERLTKENVKRSEVTFDE